LLKLAFLICETNNQEETTGKRHCRSVTRRTTMKWKCLLKIIWFKIILYV